MDKNYKFIPEICYCIEYQIIEEGYTLEFRIIACAWFENNEELTDTPFMDSYNGHYSTPENAYILCKGRCKWDGCMHINWVGGHETNYLHTKILWNRYYGGALPYHY